MVGGGGLDGGVLGEGWGVVEGDFLAEPAADEAAMAVGGGKGGGVISRSW